MKRTSSILAALFSVLALGLASSARAGIIHDYELNGTYADSLGGPPLNPNGGVLGPTGYTFLAGQGPNVSNVIDPANYAIQFGAFITDTSGYRRLIDFKNRTVDTGLYDLNGQLTFYNVVTAPTVSILPGREFELLLTRDGTTNQVNAYIDGVSQFSFTDTSSLATFTGPGNIIHLLIDDLAHPGEESGGFLDYVRIYDEPFSPTPEPTALTLLGVALASMAGYGWRRRKAVKG